MINPQDFLSALKSVGIEFVAGVPDSLLKHVCACMSDCLAPDRHVVAANEGAAVGLAIGHFLATGRPGLVYMQNSGLGNTVNPLASLTDPDVYAIPMVLLIGWRGEMLANGAQKKDEPQHVKQGRITPDLLDVLGIPYRVVGADTDVLVCLQELKAHAVARSGPTAMVVRKGAFAPYQFKGAREEGHLPSREEAIHAVLKALPNDVPVVSTTGMASREVFEHRKFSQAGHHRDFLTVGGMGHASSIAAGIALCRPELKVVCIDGDGAVLMHMGSLAITSQRPNMLHIVLNNGAHDSVGGQPTRAAEISLARIAKQCGYALVQETASIEDTTEALRGMLEFPNSCLLEIRCRRGNRPDLGRPDRTPVQNRDDFMEFLGAAKK
ncbi:phosphonopyruvate decarboxylase [Desulfonatronum thiodismutans]|uniref:phosphonopyruvate decarboxylase n=1 Tax=Desulfonatronum thiodismutans TaxID=159290 RepID=UPI0004ABDFB4|nr:phosphonopyruvate decarboxylase [Desulfonatronum thiodismutans]